MPPKANGGTNSKSIKDFFKPFTIPKNRIPRSDIIEDEIIVAAAPSPKKSQVERPALPKGRGLPQDQPSRLSESTPGTKDGPDAGVVTEKRNVFRAHSHRSSRTSTPTKAAGYNHRSTSNALPQFDGVSEDPLLHISPPGSQQRALSAVEITSPLPQAEMLPPKREDTKTVLNVSFSSVSTLSSLPASSQSSSRRTVKNGIQAVTNSDSGSDGSSDSEELADIYSFVPRKRQKLTPPEQDGIADAPSTVKPARRSARRSDEAKRLTQLRLSPSPPRMMYKHSLAKMVKQRQKQEKTEVKIREAEEAFEEAIRQREARVKDQGLEDGLAAAVADDSDQGERMKLAMARTELLQEHDSFYFFRGRRNPTSGSNDAPPADEAFTKFPKKPTREQACTYGLLAQLSSVRGLSEEARKWVAQQLTEEIRDDLCTAYVEILRASRTSDPVSRLQDFYQTSLPTDSEKDVSASDSIPTVIRPQGLSPGLQYVLDVVRDSCIANVDGPQEVADSLIELIISALDHNIQDDMTILQKYQDTIAQIVDAFTSDSKFDELCTLVLSSPHTWRAVPKLLRCRAIASVPALSTRCHRLRRLLAAHLVTDRLGDAECNLNLDSPQWNAVVLQRLKLASEFSVTDTSDYSLLTPLVSVLDIAIDSGFSDHTFTFRLACPVKTVGSVQPPQRTTEEAAFNAHIDAFTKQLRSMSSQIRDAGSSHLKRTEAKMAIDRLVLRLEWCVRTRPKPRKQMFGDNVEQQRGFLNGFLKKVSIDDRADANDREDDFAPVLSTEMLADREDDTSADNPESASGGVESGSHVDE